MWVIIDFAIILPLPILFTAIGTAILNGVRAKRNSFVGYRTPRSMRCVRSWSWAQSMLGEYLLTDGVALLILSPIILGALFIIFGNVKEKVLFALVILLLQVLTFIPVIMKIENNLRKEQNRWEIR